MRFMGRSLLAVALLTFANAAHARDALLVFQLNDVSTRVRTDRGVIPSHASGDILVGTEAFSGRDGRVTIIGGVLYLDSVATARGATGLIAVAVERGRTAGSIRVSGNDVTVEVPFEGELTCDLMDRILGVTQHHDYTVSPAERVAGAVRFSGKLDRRSGRLHGRVQVDLQVVHPLLGALCSANIPRAVLDVLHEPLVLADSNRWEICILFEYVGGAEATWASDFDEMLEDANRILAACSIRIRTAYNDKECTRVRLHTQLADGGGGNCKGKGGGKRSVIEMGHNAVGDCAKAGTTTTFGRVLAHELGHSGGLDQDSGTGNLMSDCAPVATLTQKQCDKIAMKASKSSTAEYVAQQGLVPVQQTVKEVELTFTNRSGKPADDLHIEFNKQAWIKSQDPQTFRDVKGESTTRLDLYRGGPVANNATLTLTIEGIDQAPQCRSCYWTRRDTRTGAVIPIAGCTCPR